VKVKRTIQRLAGICVAAASFAATAEISYTWTDVTPPVTYGYYPHISSIAVHPLDGKRLVVAYGDVSSGPLRATVNAGATWDAPITTPGRQTIDRVFAHPGQPGVLFVQEPGSSGYSITGEILSTSGRTYRSEDFGVSWTVIHEPSSNAELPVSPFASDPFDVNHVFATRRDFSHNIRSFGSTATGDLNVVQSRDGGRTWSAPGQGLPPRIEDTFSLPRAENYGDSSITGPTPAAPARLFLSTLGTTYVSRDLGATWNAMYAYLASPTWVRPDPRRANVLFAQVGDRSSAGFWRSEDEGATWREMLRQNTPSGYNFNAMITVDPLRSREVWLTGLAAGVHHSADGGESWQPVGLAAEYLSAPSRLLVVNPSDPGVVFVVRNNHLYRGVPSVRPDLIAVEFQYEADRYWVTALDGEALFLDYRLEPGNFRRTGERFGLWRADNAPPGAIGSCRFWSKPESGLRTRVLTLQGPECEGLKHNPGWILEAENEFFAMPPSGPASCNGDLVPVWRLNNRKPDLNHRYVVSPSIVAEMQARGWRVEGLAMCARPLRSEE
jgi:hypothetical protein